MSGVNWSKHANVVRSQRKQKQLKPKVHTIPRKMAPMSKKSMISLIEAWEDQKDQYSTMKDFVEAFYKDQKTSSKKVEEESEGSNEAESKTPRIKVTIKAPKEKKPRATKSKKMVTNVGDTESETNEKKPRALSKYQEFLKEWRTQNPEVKGKEAIKQGAAAWQEHKTIME